MSLWSYDLTRDTAIQRTAHVVRCGNDICLYRRRRTAPYRSGSFGIARPSLKKPDAVSSSSSVICVTGHKEDDLPRWPQADWRQSLAVRNVCVGDISMAASRRNRKA